MISFEKCMMCGASANPWFRNERVCGEACFADLRDHQQAKQRQEAQEKIEKLHRQGTAGTNEGRILKGLISQALLYLATGEAERGRTLLEQALTLDIQSLETLPTINN